MTATLTFNLPEDMAEYTAAINGQKYKSVLWEYDQWLRNEIKYNNAAYLEAARTKLHEFLTESNITIDD